MKRIRTAILPLLFLGLAFAGCSNMFVEPKKEKPAEEKPAIVTMEQALFCFKCHSRGNWEGKNGKFPHPAHEALLKDIVGGKLHCNQCHDIRGHGKMKTIAKSNAPCSNCH